MGISLTLCKPTISSGKYYCILDGTVVLALFEYRSDAIDFLVNSPTTTDFTLTKLCIKVEES